MKTYKELFLEWERELLLEALRAAGGEPGARRRESGVSPQHDVAQADGLRNHRRRNCGHKAQTQSTKGGKSMRGRGKRELLWWIYLIIQEFWG